jgi:hypothetical protein
MSRGHSSTRTFTIACLVIKKHIGTKRPKKLSFFASAKKQAFIQTNVPRAQGFDDALMCGGCAGGDKRGSNWTSRLIKLALEPVEPFKERLKGAAVKRFIGSQRFAIRKRIESIIPINALGLV